MPRGGTKFGRSDARRGILVDTEAVSAFDAALMSQYGIHPNAEAMIRSHRVSQDPVLQKLLLIKENPEESEKARADLAAAAKKVGLDPDEVVVKDAAVHGNGVVVVYEDEHGNYLKAGGPWNDQYVAPKLSQLEEQERSELAAHEEVAVEVARLKADAELAVLEAKAEVDAQLQEEIASIRAQAQETLQTELANLRKQIQAGTSEAKAKAKPRAKRAPAKSKRAPAKPKAQAVATGAPVSRPVLEAPAKPDGSGESGGADEGGSGRSQ